MPQVNEGYSLDHSYRAYCKTVAKKAQKFKISKKEYRDICKEFINSIVDTALNNGQSIPLPYGLGDLRIRRSLTIPPQGLEKANRELKIDWLETNKLWKEHPELKEKKQFVYFLNDHSDGWYAVWHWSKFNIRIKGKRAYSFEPCWTNKRRLAKLMKQPKWYQRYFTL
jgi:hypothetical protein